MAPPGLADAPLAECSICYESYRGASSGRAPKLLWCQHCVCLACLRKLACRSAACPSVVCPFCRTVTAVPEGGLRALRDDERLLREMGAPAEEEAEEGGKDAPRPRGDPALEFGGYRPGAPVFAVSGFVPAYAGGLPPGVGLIRLQEVQSAVLVELPSRPGPERLPAVENLRLCFAVTILLLIVSVFFALVFFK